MKKLTIVIALSIFATGSGLNAQQSKTSTKKHFNLTGNFSTQLSKIICSWQNDFSALRGEKLIQSSDLLFKSNIQLEGGLSSEIKMGKFEVDFGRIEDQEQRFAAFYELKDQIQNSSVSCCKLVADPEGSKEMMFIQYSQKWRIASSTDPAMKDLVVSLSLSGSRIYLTVEISSGDSYDDDDDW